MSTLPANPEAFIDHWTRAEANERANSQAFLLGLAQLLGVPAPSNSHATGYSFEYPAKVPGGSSTNFIDLYRRGHFVFESKQFAARREELTGLEAAAIFTKLSKPGPQPTWLDRLEVTLHPLAA